MENHNLYGIEGYYVATKFIRTTHIHGGVSIHVRNNITSQPIPEIEELSVERQCALAACFLRKINTVVITAYVPPDANTDLVLDVFEDALQSVVDGFRPDVNIILSGNFNNLMKASTEPWMQLLESFDLRPSISKPTRATAHTSSTVDNIFSNIENYNADTRSPIT